MMNIILVAICATLVTLLVTLIINRVYSHRVYQKICSKLDSLQGSSLTDLLNQMNQKIGDLGSSTLSEQQKKAIELLLTQHGDVCEKIKNIGSDLTYNQDATKDSIKDIMNHQAFMEHEFAELTSALQNLATVFIENNALKKESQTLKQEQYQLRKNIIRLDNSKQK